MKKVGECVYVVHLSVGRERYATYTLPSNLPFPSPLGTNICLGCEDEHLEDNFHIAEVISYEHKHYYEQGVGSFMGDLWMGLVEAGSVGAGVEPKTFRVKPECYADFREQMIDSGWEIEEESSELRPEES